MADQQDMRRLGGLLNFLPFTYTAILIASFSLCALPFLTGNYSKELIIELAGSHYLLTGSFAYWIGTITAGLTAFYSFRLISLTFFSYPNAIKIDYLHTHEQPLVVVIPFILLIYFSIFFGFFTKDLFIGLGSDFFNATLFIQPDHIFMVEAEFGSSLLYKLLPTFLTIIMATLSFYLYNLYPFFVINLTESRLGLIVYQFFNGKWLIDNLYNYYIINKALSLGFITSKILDKGAIELLGPNGFSRGLYTGSNWLSWQDTGLVTSYSLYMLMALLLITLGLFFPLIFDITYSIDFRYFILFIAIAFNSIYYRNIRFF